MLTWAVAWLLHKDIRTPGILLLFAMGCDTSIGFSVAAALAKACKP